MKPIRQFKTDQLEVRVFPDRVSCGRAAAAHVGDLLRTVLEAKARASIVFGAAPSQNEFFAALAEEKKIDWTEVTAFQMDEYIGIAPTDPRALRNYLERYLFGKRRPGQTPFLETNAGDPAAECRRYAALLAQNPLDVSCLGIGESCHLAYNDPHVARFDDPATVKVVEVDEVSRMQQVHDGTVARVEDAIVQAYTLTIPTLVRVPHVSCVAPGKIKAAAVARTLRDPIHVKTPSTILRTHPSAVLFLDQDSASGA